MEDFDAEILTVLGVSYFSQRVRLRDLVLTGQVQRLVMVVDALPSVTISAVRYKYSHVDGVTLGEYAGIVSRGEGESCGGYREVGLELQGPHISVVARGDCLIFK